MRILLCIFLILTLGRGVAVAADVAPPKTVFMHSVYFWLHDNVTDVQNAEFKSLLKTFKKIKYVKSVRVGVPAGTPRAIVDNSYDVTLIVTFKDRAGHDYYQADKIHTDAIKIFEGWIRDIKIYDAILE